MWTLLHDFIFLWIHKLYDAVEFCAVHNIVLILNAGRIRTLTIPLHMGVYCNWHCFDRHMSGSVVWISEICCEQRQIASKDKQIRFLWLILLWNTAIELQVFVLRYMIWILADNNQICCIWCNKAKCCASYEVTSGKRQPFLRNNLKFLVFFRNSQLHRSIWSWWTFDLLLPHRTVDFLETWRL